MGWDSPQLLHGGRKHYTLGGVVALTRVLGTKADIWDLGELGLSHSKSLTSEMDERPQDPKNNWFGTASDNTPLCNRCIAGTF